MNSLTNVNGTLFFQGDDGVHGYELWKSDGTEAGTVMVKDIYEGSQGSSPGLMTDVGGTMFFAADDGIHGTELWKSDGTEAGHRAGQRHQHGAQLFLAGRLGKHQRNVVLRGL